MEKPSEASATPKDRPSLKRVVKAWGEEIWLCNTELYCAKVLKLYPGWQCSLHRHKLKDETFLVLSGTCQIELGGMEREMGPLERAHVLPGVWHRFRNEKGSGFCEILEVSTHHDDTDVERLEESRKIPSTPSSSMTESERL